MSERRRTYRVAERIRELIAQELLGMADPRLELVTVTSVVISPDLRHAKVYWMASGNKERIPSVNEAFQSAAGPFRRLLAKELGIRFVPEIKFFYDDTFDTVREVESLLDRVAAASPKEPQEGTDDTPSEDSDEEDS